MEKHFSPIVLFVYNRPEHTKKTLEALVKNELSEYSDLYIYADGPKDNATDEQIGKIEETRLICKSIKGFKSICILESEKNKGLAQNIITGVTDIVNKYGRVIVLEDDIITAKYFLTYMNRALEKYENYDKAYAISGWYYPIESDKNDAFFLSNFNCWGWATWKSKWSCFKKDATYYKQVFTKQQRYKFNLDGVWDYWSQIEDNYEKIINTWFIFWYASAFLYGGLCLYPSRSLVKNDGCDGTGEHCNVSFFDDYCSDDFEIESFPDECSENIENKEKLKIYLKKINSKFRFRTLLRNFLRKIKLYGIIRIFYMKIKKHLILKH